MVWPSGPSGRSFVAPVNGAVADMLAPSSSGPRQRHALRLESARLQGHGAHSRHGRTIVAPRVCRVLDKWVVRFHPSSRAHFTDEEQEAQQL
ncbi:Tastin [Manis pentadactyla]|nr:Tastin [Manis pentadactyla]